jgi:WD40-like Beta Propeller Repeat
LSLGDLKILPMEGDPVRGWTPGNPTVFLSTPANETNPMFSPDGRWIAYNSDDSSPGRSPAKWLDRFVLNISDKEASPNPDVYVRPFPGPGGTWRVSTDGGAQARWSTTAHELLFLNPTQSKMMVAPYAVIGDSFRADKPQIWSPTILALLVNYDLHPDGKRLATIAAQNQGIVVQDKVVFIFNFFDYLQKIAPGAK